MAVLADGCIYSDQISISTKYAHQTDEGDSIVVCIELSLEPVDD